MRRKGDMQTYVAVWLFPCLQEGGGAEVVQGLRRAYAYALRSSLLSGYAADQLNLTALEGMESDFTCMPECDCKFVVGDFKVRPLWLHTSLVFCVFTAALVGCTWHQEGSIMRYCLDGDLCIPPP